MITRDVLASQIRNYLQHRITHSALVDWAERAMMDEEFDAGDSDTLRDIIGRLGVADSREFGVTWEEFESYLSQLGYRTKVDVVRAG